MRWESYHDCNRSSQPIESISLAIAATAWDMLLSSDDIDCSPQNCRNLINQYRSSASVFWFLASQLLSSSSSLNGNKDRPSSKHRFKWVLPRRSGPMRQLGHKSSLSPRFLAITRLIVHTPTICFGSQTPKSFPIDSVEPSTQPAEASLVRLVLYQNRTGEELFGFSINTRVNLKALAVSDVCFPLATKTADCSLGQSWDSGCDLLLSVGFVLHSLFCKKVTM